MLQYAPRELLLLHQHLQPCLVRKEQRQIGRQNAMLHQTQHLLVLAGRQLAENVVAILLQNRHRLIEVMVLHGRRTVDGRYRRRRVQHELVVFAAMVQIVAQRSDEQGQPLVRPERVHTVLDDAVHGVRHREAVRPIVVRHTPVVLPDGQREAHQRRLIEALQPEQIDEHVNGAHRLAKVVERKRIERERIDLRHPLRYALDQTMLHLLRRARVMVAEHLEGDAVLLLRPPDLVVQLGVMQCEAAVHGERFERLLVVARERAAALVHHLDDADQRAAYEDRHAQNGGRLVAGLRVDVAIEARIGVGVGNVEHLAVEGHLAGNAGADGEADLLNGWPAGRSIGIGGGGSSRCGGRARAIAGCCIGSVGRTDADVKNGGVQFFVFRVDQEQGCTVGVDQALSELHDFHD